METNVDEHTLKAIRLLNAKKYHFKYQITVTPKGKGQTHHTLYNAFRKELFKYKCVKDVFLIAEFENTCHFHGYVYTKDKCKFLNLFSKKHPFNFRISEREELVWMKYILKHNNKQYI